MTDPISSAPAPRPNDPSTPKRIPTAPLKIPLPQGVNNIRSGVQSLTVFSPLNQDGSYAFDRVIKAGQLLKRTRKTKHWKPIHIVLRPNAISLYKDADQTKLRHQIILSELTAVARQKDPKGKTQHVFGLFSPSRNFHLSANTDKEAQDWVELIRNEARIDEDEEEMLIMSPMGHHQDSFQGFGRARKDLPTSSTGVTDSSHRPPSSVSKPVVSGQRQTSYHMEYSGNEQGSYSDFSDTAGPGGALESNLSLSNPNHENRSPVAEAQAVYGLARTNTTTAHRNGSQSSVARDENNNERVISHGWLALLKSKSGVRQWKKLWVVLRPKSLAFYKNEEEYSANLLIPFHSIIDAVEIDPVSKTKRHCLQIITEERNYRFCASDEEALTRWLGAFKSLLAKRKEEQKGRSANANANVNANPSASESRPSAALLQP